MLVIGLTGSIGMGKSTTASMFAGRGVPVHDADAAVHDLYRGEAVPLIQAAFPGTVRNGSVDRSILAGRVVGDRDAFARLESIVHPLVRKRDERFRDEARSAGRRVCVVDIPMLFETGGDKRVDVCLVVTAKASVQRERVLARPDMTEERFEAILAKQMPDAEKRRRAHFLVDTGSGFQSAERQVDAILRAVAGM
ncbi:MAG: dephospho-CoA kinase [Pseudomonadota bacterium]